MTFPSVTDTHVRTHCSCLALITRNAQAHVSTCQSLALILVFVRPGVIFYSSHPLHFYTNQTRGVCAWLTLSPCLRELRRYRGDYYEVKNRCWSHVPREWSGAPPRPPLGGSPLTGTILTPPYIIF